MCNENKTDAGRSLKRMVSLRDAALCLLHDWLGIARFRVVQGAYVSEPMTASECRNIVLHIGGDIFWTGGHPAKVEFLTDEQANEKLSGALKKEDPNV